MNAYWWCPECRAEVSGACVTPDEKHDLCGHLVVAVKPGDPIDLLLGELTKKELRLAAMRCPKDLWAVKPNPRSNDFNTEPEYRIIHYHVHAYEPETGRYYVNTDGFPGLRHRHWVNGKKLYTTRVLAEVAMKEVGGGG